MTTSYDAAISLHRELSWQEEDQAARLGLGAEMEDAAALYRPGWLKRRECFSPIEPFVALDFETTGVVAGRDQIVEIGALRVLPGNHDCASFHRLVSIEGGVPPRVRELTGIDDEQLASQGVDPYDALVDLVAFLGDSPLVAYNAAFDVAFLNAGCEAYGLTTSDAHHSCALRLARRAWPRLPSHKLTYVAERLGFQVHDGHRALGDAHRAASVYRAAAIECLGIHHLASAQSRAILASMQSARSSGTN